MKAARATGSRLARQIIVRVSSPQEAWLRRMGRTLDLSVSAVVRVMITGAMCDDKLATRVTRTARGLR